MYAWKSNKLTRWNPPIPPGSWPGYTQSSDGVYQLYANGGLYKGQERINAEVYGQHWLGNTHLFLLQEPEENDEKEAYTTRLSLYDADSRVKRTIATGLPVGTEVIGTSPDGKWMYVKAHADVQPIAK